MRLRSAFLAAALAIMAMAFSCNAKTQAVPHQGVISWTFTPLTGTTATFTLFRGSATGGPYPVTVKTGITGNSFTDTPLTANTHYCWNVKVVIATAATGSGYSVGDTSAFAATDTCGDTQKDPVPTATGLASVVQ